MQIQWYPGHMAKTKRMLAEDIRSVDIVMELLDARIPLASKNPDIDILAKEKRRIVILNKRDLADSNISAEWKKYFEAMGQRVVMTDSTGGVSVSEVAKTANEMMKDRIERLREKGRISVTIRAMVLGIPNVGKSTFINKMVGRAITETGDRPGVTRSRQWVRIYKGIELLDTPGILWPKIDDPKSALKLAFTGAIRDNNLDMVTLAQDFIGVLREIAPDAIKNRYKIDYEAFVNNNEILELIARARGFIMKGGNLDIERASIILLDEFRAAKLGRISLEKPMVR